MNMDPCAGCEETSCAGCIIAIHADLEERARNPEARHSTLCLCSLCCYPDRRREDADRRAPDPLRVGRPLLH